MSGPLKYYFDFMSQPSRALYIFFKKAKIPFEPVPVALRNGEYICENFFLFIFLCYCCVVVFFIPGYLFNDNYYYLIIFALGN